MLREFNDKDMIEQIVILDEIKESGRIDLLPDLMSLYATPHADQAVEEVIYHTLFALLAKAPDAVIAGLRHSSARVRLVAIHRAGDDQTPAALPILIEQLQTTMNPESLAAIIKALGQFHDPALTGRITPFVNHADDTVAAFARQALESLNNDSERHIS